MSLSEKLTSLMERAPIMLFMKGNPDNPQCGFSRQTVGILRGEGVEFGWFDIFSDQEVREGLKKHNDWPSTFYFSSLPFFLLVGYLTVPVLLLNSSMWSV